jgi:CopG family nickel-responsive transcriptional regulator
MGPRAGSTLQIGEGDEEIVGTITLVYDHHTRELGDSLAQVQHDHSAAEVE